MVDKYLVRLRGRRRRLMVLRLLVGLAAAGSCLLLSPFIAAVAERRPGFVPVGMAILLAGLLHPRVRHWFIISLCFSVSLMALREAIQSKSLPLLLDSPLLNAAFPWAWIVLAVLSGTAGLLEAETPGSVAARRFYFASAAVYFIGHGFTSFHEEPNWQNLALTVIGLAAAVATGFAHRLDYPPESLGENTDSEIDREERRRRVVAEREWIDPKEGALHPPNRS